MITRHNIIGGLLALLLTLASTGAGSASSAAPTRLQPWGPDAPQAPNAGKVYLPFLGNTSGEAGTPRVNAPYFADSIGYNQTAIFWFGQVTSTQNYTDVRVGYTDRELYVNLAVFDRYLWYDPESSGKNLEQWDAASLYLSLDGRQGSSPAPGAYRFTGQLTWWEPRANYQEASQGSGSSWVVKPVPFTTEAGWRGNAPNNDTSGEDRGWTLTYSIPFSSLGLSGPPAPGTQWGMGLILHDRDSQAGAPVDSGWPAGIDAKRPGTWAELSFGMPSFTSPSVASPQTTTIRNQAGGPSVADAAVGGSIDNLCPGSADFIWNSWGNADFHSAPSINIQNQGDVADWPCFAKYYITFPLDSIPAGKAISTAVLTLYQFGNSGGGDWGAAPASIIQVLTTLGDWQESALNWNNAPQAQENVSQAQVDALASYPGWNGVARSWDLSRAAAQAYAAGQPLRLVLYSADYDYHSGKYFFSSEYENTNARPKLEVTWGDP